MLNFFDDFSTDIIPRNPWVNGLYTFLTSQCRGDEPDPRTSGNEAAGWSIGLITWLLFTLNPTIANSSIHYVLLPILTSGGCVTGRIVGPQVRHQIRNVRHIVGNCLAPSSSTTDTDTPDTTNTDINIDDPLTQIMR